MDPVRPLPIVAALDARWDCHSCGACCRGPEGVSVTAAEAHAIEQHDWAREGPEFARAVVDARLDEASGETRRRLRQPGGRCVFLTKTNRCLVELKLGWARKPLPCRLFPYKLVEDADGNVEVVASTACRSLHESFETGTPLEKRGDVLQLVLEGAPRLALEAEELPLLGRGMIGRDAYRALLLETADATRVSGPLEELPWRAARPLKQALGELPPPFPFEGPPETPFYQALQAVCDHLGPIALSRGWKRLAGAIDGSGRWLGFRKAARGLDPQAERFTRASFRIFLREGRALEQPDVTAGLGLALYAAVLVTCGAARMGELVRQGAKGNAADANEVAAEAALLLDDKRARPIVRACHDAFRRIILDAPAPER